MRILKSHPLFSLINGYLVDSPQPSNINHLLNLGSLLVLCLIIQILTNITMHYNYNTGVLEAFNWVELHSNTAWLLLSVLYLYVVILFTVCIVILPHHLPGFSVVSTMLFLGFITLFGLFFISYVVFDLFVPFHLVIIVISVINLSIWRAYIFEIAIMVVSCYLFFYGVEVILYGFDSIVLMCNSKGSGGSGYSTNPTQNTGGFFGGGPQNNGLGVFVPGGSESTRNSYGETESPNTTNIMSDISELTRDPNRMRRLPHVIDDNIKRIIMGVDVWESNDRARVALSEYINIARRDHLETNNDFIVSQRVDKARNWLQLLDSLEDNQRKK